jgi:hypothetical protein
MHDLSGKAIVSLVNNYLGMGSYRYGWNTQSIAPGFYTVRMKAGENTYIKNVLILR